MFTLHAHIVVNRNKSYCVCWDGLKMAALEKVLDQVDTQQLRQSPRPIDLVHLSKQSLGDPGLEDEILLMYDQMVLTQMSRIRETIDVDTILFCLHGLKGASAGVGANNVAGLAKAAEDEMKANNALSHECLADLRMGVEEVRHYIAELLGD